MEIQGNMKQLVTKYIIKRKIMQIKNSNHYIGVHIDYPNNNLYIKFVKNKYLIINNFNSLI
jgi:hypothetical protein